MADGATETTVQTDVNINENQADDWSSNIEIVDDAGDTMPDNNVQRTETQSDQLAEPIPDASTQTEAKPGEETEKPVEKPQGFDSQFITQDKKGEQVFDGQKGLDFLTKSNSFAYKSDIVPTADPAPVADAEKPVDEPAWKAEVTDWGTNLKKDQLSPLQDVYQLLAGAGLATNEVKLAFDQIYVAKEQDINNKIEEKRMGWLAQNGQDIKSRSDSAHEKRKMEENSQHVQGMVAREIGGWDQYNQLVFGHTDKTGAHHRGYGADVIDWVFKLLNGSKELTTTQYNDAYKDMWTKLSSNEQNVRMITKLSSGMYALANMDKFRKAYVEADQKQTAQVREGLTNKPHAGQSNARSSTGVDALDTFLGGAGVDTI